MNASAEANRLAAIEKLRLKGLQLESIASKQPSPVVKSSLPSKPLLGAFPQTPQPSFKKQKEPLVGKICFDKEGNLCIHIPFIANHQMFSAFRKGCEFVFTPSYFLENIATIKKELGIGISPAWAKCIIRITAHYTGASLSRRSAPISFSQDMQQLVAKNSILPFQKAGISFGIHLGGRFLLADEMGLGKTLQALMVAYHYRYEWPMLILCPSSLIGTWLEASTAAYESAGVQVDGCFDGKVLKILLGASSRVSVIITSYDLAVRNIKEIEKISFGVVIADECHTLKSATTKRTTTLQPLLTKANRLIMLSGTPALSRPIELYTQLKMIDQKLFPSARDFGLRYCAGFQTRFGYNFTGASNLAELNDILANTVMIRRLKSDVLNWLPTKMRKQIFLYVPQPSTSVGRQTSNLQNLEDLSEENSSLFQQWQAASEKKLDAIKEYLGNLLRVGEETDDRCKVLLFAHFRSTLGYIEDWLIENGVSFIKIDGSTNSQQRQQLCSAFQNDPSIHVALLGITAASVGLTFTSAKLVVFLELYWNPGTLLQAEDRVHRIGQNDSVNIHYLLAKGTFDDILWPMLLKKLKVLTGSIGMSADGQLEKIQHQEIFN